MCEIKVAAFGHISKDVSLYPAKSQVEMIYYQENVQWKIKKMKLIPFGLPGNDGIVSAVLHLQRRPEYYALNILAPIFLLCFLNPFVFLLPPESGERISYTVTIFLSLAVFMTLFSDTMPKSSEPMSRISYFLLIAMTYSTVLCIVAILLMRIYYTNETKTTPRWLLRLVAALSCQCCRCKEKSNVKTTQVSGVPNVQEKLPEFGTPDEDEYVRNVKDWKGLAAELDNILFVYSLIFIFMLVLSVLLALS